MSRKVTIRVAQGTANWLRFKELTDHERGAFRAAAARRLIEFWERLKPYTQWTPISALVMSPDPSRVESRWIRRNLWTLEMAGLVERRAHGTGQGITEFRLKRKP